MSLFSDGTNLPENLGFDARPWDTTRCEEVESEPMGFDHPDMVAIEIGPFRVKTDFGPLAETRKVGMMPDGSVWFEAVLEEGGEITAIPAEGVEGGERLQDVSGLLFDLIEACQRLSDDDLAVRIVTRYVRYFV